MHSVVFDECVLLKVCYIGKNEKNNTLIKKIVTF